MIGAEALQGHWRRDWLTAPGRHDATTRVHWLQSGLDYADLRIPLERPDPGAARCLADLPNPALAALMQAEGFAGTIAVEDGVCTWTRRINWHGRSETVDAGRVHFEGGALMEIGVQADYSERWVAEPGGASRAERFRFGALWGIVVQVGPRFVVAVGDEAASPSDPIRLALAEGRRPDGLADHFRGSYTLGHWEGEIGHADLSTNPFVEGKPVLERHDVGLLWYETGFDGARRKVALMPA